MLRETKDLPLVCSLSSDLPQLSTHFPKKMPKMKHKLTTPATTLPLHLTFTNLLTNAIRPIRPTTSLLLSTIFSFPGVE